MDCPLCIPFLPLTLCVGCTRVPSIRTPVFLCPNTCKLQPNYKPNAHFNTGNKTTAKEGSEPQTPSAALVF